MNQTADKRMPSGGSLAWKVLLPVLIGVGVAVWLMCRDFNGAVWSAFRLDWRVAGCLVLAVVVLVGRDFGFAWRFRVLTDRTITWASAIRVTMLCEFTSAITPSAVGGSSFGMVYMKGEGVDFGRATALMMTTLLLDELFFVIACPLAILTVPYMSIFGFDQGAVSDGICVAFWVVYGLIAVWTAVLVAGILVWPKVMYHIISKLFSIKWLRRWHAQACRLGADMEATGRELRHRGAIWWGRAFGATALSWISRFLMVNALFLAFAPGAPQLVVLARQTVVWVLLMASPTPGGSGISEWLFTTYYGDMISPGVALVIAMIWRVLSYYIYLIAGACIIPGWIRSNYRKIRDSLKNF